MHTEIKKWGNSAVVRLPAAMLAQLNLAVGAPVELKAENGRMIIEPSIRRPKYKLEDLLAEMPGDLPRVEGWEEMHAVGKEAN